MKKNILGIKGFAMSELLAASIVILLLFSILFANYLPLVSEFENRILYTDVTANYGAFYVRKIYKTALEDSQVKATLNDGLTHDSYYTVYKKSSIDEAQLVSGELKSQLEDIIDEYDIEEIIITNYKLDNLKGRNQEANAPTRYKKSSGSLYNYINYLPYYSLAVYEGKVAEPYRIILKSKSGFATTQILPDPLTPVSCFEFDKNSLNTGKFIITNYHKGCGQNVDITPNEITIGTGSNAKTGIITAIMGDDETKKGAFQDKEITSINLSKNITSIGDYAFKDNNIKKFSFKYNAPGVTTIGKYAFSNNKLTNISIPSNLTKISEGAFANNYLLQAIEFDYDSTTPDKYIPKNMFGLEGNTGKTNNYLIELVIPANITSIQANAFKNIQFSSIRFENSDSNPSRLHTIETSAFGIDEELFDNLDPNNYISLSIPHTVQKISSSAFENVKIEALVFETNSTPDGKEHSSLETIGNSAFKVKVKETDETKIETRSIKIPVSVTTIGNQAFENQALSGIVFDSLTENSNLSTIGDFAFSGNKFKTFIIPQNLITDGTYIGKNIFGDNYTLGNNTTDIIINSNISLVTNWNNTWCKAFYGDSGCTEAVSTNGPISIYKNGSNTKYITYIDN